MRQSSQQSSNRFRCLFNLNRSASSKSGSKFLTCEVGQMLLLIWWRNPAPPGMGCMKNYVNHCKFLWNSNMRLVFMGNLKIYQVCLAHFFSNIQPTDGETVDWNIVPPSNQTQDWSSEGKHIQKRSTISRPSRSKVSSAKNHKCMAFQTCSWDHWDHLNYRKFAVLYTHLKLTQPLKIGLHKRKVVFPSSIFRGELLASGMVWLCIHTNL